MDPSTPGRRSEVVLSLLKGETSLEQAAQDGGVSVAEIAEWERRFVLGGVRALQAADAGDTWYRSRRFRLAALGVVMAWLALRVAYWNGYYTEDAPGYVTDAVYFALGNFHARDYVTGLNVGTFLPVAVPLRVFGKLEWALSLWPLFCSLLGLVSLAGAAGILLGRRAALLTGLLYATYPGDIFFSTVVMPDAIQAGWLSFSMFLVVRGCARRVDYRVLAAGGLAMGFCHLVRANGVFLVPVGLVAVVVLARKCSDSIRVPLRGAMVYLAGWLAVQVVEGFVYLWAARDFFHRFTVVARHYGTARSLAQWGLNTDLGTIPFSIFPPLLWMRTGDWGRLNQDQAYHAFTFFLAVASIVAGVIAIRFAARAVRDRLTAPLVVGVFWFAWPILYHQFGSQSLTEFVPIHRLSRHIVVYAPGAIFATVVGWAAVRDSLTRAGATALRRMATAAAMVVLLAQLLFCWQGEVVAFEAFHRIKGTYARIRSHLPAALTTLVGDPGDLCFFDFWLNPLGAERVKMVVFEKYSACAEMTDGVVLTRSNPGWEAYGAPIIRDTVARLPCLVAPPPGWRLLYDGFPEKVFVIDGLAPDRLPQ